MRAADTPDPTRRLSSETTERIADTMFALATPSRLQILWCLRGGPRSVSEIIDAVGMEQTAVSHQLRVLRDHDAVSVRRSGRQRLYSLRSEHIAALLDDAHGHVRALDGKSPVRRADEAARPGSRKAAS
jgi:ArsR family transcriptional regulator, nickel/cobalt-responsive transcriptional repressor